MADSQNKYFIGAPFCDGSDFVHSKTQIVTVHEKIVIRPTPSSDARNLKQAADRQVF